MKADIKKEIDALRKALEFDSIKKSAAATSHIYHQIARLEESLAQESKK